MQVTKSPEKAAPNWTNADYHSDTSRISKSGLDKIAKSPAHYFHHYLSDQRPKKEETPALKLGTAIHAAILEPAEFAANYAFLNDAEIVAEIGGGNPRLTTKYKAWKAEFELNNLGKIILSAADYQACEAMRTAVLAHPTAAKLLAAPGLTEQTFLFVEPISGAMCKARPDKVSVIDAVTYLIDIKSTEDASVKEFGRSAANYGYDKQAAFYSDGFTQATGLDVEAFVFIAVEKSAPYNVAVYFADDEVIELGRAKYRAECATYAQCIETGRWPGYGDEVNSLKIPAYAFTK